MSEMYKKSGVDLDEAEKLNHKLCKNIKNKNIKMFAGSVYLENLDVNILNCCDGIGSKIIPLYERKLYKTIAVDLVAANLNDLATVDAQAVSFSDYIAVNKLDSTAVSEIVMHLENELSRYNCTLAGGETSEIPHLLREGTIDICGFATGIAKSLNTTEICPDDVVIGLKSSGIHANGFTLIRKLYAEGRLSAEEFENSLAPSFVYYNFLRKLWESKLIKAGANVTGGGIHSNLVRIIPPNLAVNLDLKKIPAQKIFQKLEKIMGEEVFNVFNCGVGFCVVANPVLKEEIFKLCQEFPAFEAFEFGKVVLR